MQHTVTKLTTQNLFSEQKLQEKPHWHKYRSNEYDREINGPFHTRSSKIILKGRERLFYVCPMVNEPTVPFINLCCAFEHYFVCRASAAQLFTQSMGYEENRESNNDIFKFGYGIYFRVQHTAIIHHLLYSTEHWAHMRLSFVFEFVSFIRSSCMHCTKIVHISFKILFNFSIFEIRIMITL